MKGLLLAVCGMAAGACAAFGATGFSTTYNVTAVAKVNTGAVRVANTDTVTPTSAVISWGDGSATPGYVAQPCVHCDIWGNHTYSTAGQYTITVKYNTGCCVSYSTNTKATVRNVGVDDFVIVSVGDSIASGEGNPVLPLFGANPPLWDDGIGGASACHLSSSAGPALAVKSLRAQNVGKTITFLHLACSGASIGGTQTQITAAKTALGGLHRVNALVMTTGANSIASGFGDIVKTCASEPNCANDTQLASDIQAGLAALPGEYYQSTTDSLLKTVNQLNPEETYIAEYHDPTHDSNGNFPDPLTSTFCDLSVISSDEWKFLYNSLVLPLNGAVAQAANATSWHHIGGIAQAFRTHGYCAVATWVVDVANSVLKQGNLSGTAHPNAAGHQFYGNKIASAINLYTKPTTTLLLEPYHPGSWSQVAVTGKMSATNELPSAGVGTMYYAVDSVCTAGSPGIPYTGPFTISADGNHSVCYASANTLGTLEAFHTATVLIDKTPPVTTATLSGAKLSIAAADATSGVSSTFIRIDNQQTSKVAGCSSVPLPTSCVITLTPGSHKVTYYSVDNARNQETTKSWSGIVQ